MTRTVVRVTQTYEEIIEEYVDIEVVHEDGVSPYSIRQHAEALVQAQDDCGHDIQWIEGRVEQKPYPSPKIRSRIFSPDASEEVTDNGDIIQPPPTPE